MKKIQDLENELKNATQQCRESRTELGNAKQQIAVGGLYITALYRKRQLYKVQFFFFIEFCLHKKENQKHE
jgi:hypothetical protein